MHQYVSCACFTFPHDLPMSGSSFIAAMFPAIGATWQRPQVAVKDMFRIRGYPMLEGSLWPEGSDRNGPAEKDGRVMEL